MNISNKIAVPIITICCFLIMILLFNSFYYKVGDQLKTAQTIAVIESELKDKNLSIPFPNSDFNMFLSNEKQIEEYFNLPIEEFHEVLKREYIYEIDTYNCKYWSYVWGLWWIENKDKYDLTFELIDTNNHVFTLIYNDSMYCTADQDVLNCINLS